MNSDLIIEVGRLRRPPSASMELELFETRQSIIKTLIEMRKAGIFRAVYCDDNRLAVVLPSEADVHGTIRQSISWMDALKMVDEFLGKSSPKPFLKAKGKP
jgi:hypothetical protein